MFTSSDIDNNALVQWTKSISESGTAGSSNIVSIQSNANHRSTGRQIVENISTHLPHQLFGVAPPIGSGVASSMELFAPTESKTPRMMNNTSRTNTTTSLSVSANKPTTSAVGDIGMYGHIPTPVTAGTKRNKNEATKGSNFKTIYGELERENPTAFTSRNSPKKMKHSSNSSTEGNAVSSTAFRAVDTKDTELSFERAAVVAALTTLYGAPVKKQDPTRRTNTNTNTSLSDSLPMLSKQLKHDCHTVFATSHGTAIGSIADATIVNGLDAKAAMSPLGPLQHAHSKCVPKTAAASTGNVVASTPVKKNLSKNNATNTNSLKSTATQYPSQYDVLLGRGKSNKNHPGNVWFQDYIQANRDRYFNAPTNVQKRHITMEILETIRKKGRFLRRGAHGWVDVCTADVQQKVAHALQYRRRCELRDDISPESPVPHVPIIDHPPHPNLSESNPRDNVQNNTNFDANTIALAMMSKSGNYSMAHLDAQTRQEQFRVNQEYYQNYFNNYYGSSDSGNQRNAGRDSNGTSHDDFVISNLQQQQHPLFTLSQAQQLRLPEALQFGNATTVTDASTMSNLLLRRLGNIDYRNTNAVMNGSNVVTNLDPATMLHVVDTASTSDDQQSSPPSSDNLDSSGLHSLADVISQIYGQEEK